MGLITSGNLTYIKKEQGSIPASLNPEVRCSDEPVTTNLLSLFAVAKVILNLQVCNDKMIK
jgi:hypothetical protein